MLRRNATAEMATFGRRGLVTALGLGVALLGAMRLPGAQAANVTVSPDDASVSYIGSWTDQSNGQHKFAGQLGASTTVQFTGSAVWWLGAHNANGAQASISIDGGSSVLVDESAGMSKNDATVEGVPLYGVTGLDGTKSHTIQVSWAANGALTGGYLSVYGFIYDNSPGQQTTTPTYTPAVTQPATMSHGQAPNNNKRDTAAHDAIDPHSGLASVVVSNGQAQTQVLFTSGSATLTQVVSVGTTVLNGQTHTQPFTMLAGSAGSAGLAGAAGASGSNGKGATSNTVPIGASVVVGVVRGVFVAVLLTLIILYLRWQRHRRLATRKHDHEYQYRPGPATAERGHVLLLSQHTSSTGAFASTDALVPSRSGSPSPSDVSTNTEGLCRLVPMSPWSPGGRPTGAPAASVGAYTLGHRRSSAALASQFAFRHPDGWSKAGGSTTDAGAVSDSLVSLSPPPSGVFPATKL